MKKTLIVLTFIAFIATAFVNSNTPVISTNNDSNIELQDTTKKKCHKTGKCSKKTKASCCSKKTKASCCDKKSSECTKKKECKKKCEKKK